MIEAMRLGAKAVPRRLTVVLSRQLAELQRRRP
jgi:hypothetical protein